MMATFVDQSWAFPDHEIGFDFNVAKQKVRNAFEGFDYIGAFEPAVYPNEELTTESGTGSLVSFHAHVIVWCTSESKLRRHKLKIAKRFTPLSWRRGAVVPKARQVEDDCGLSNHASIRDENAGGGVRKS